MKQNYIILAVLMYSLLTSTIAWAQNVGDFQTHQTGNWNTTSTWERWDGSTWVTPAPSTPTSSDEVITIRNGHTVTVTADVTVDQVTVDTGGQVTVNNYRTLTVADGAETDLTVNGTLSAGTLTFNGSALANGGAITVITTNFNGSGAQSISGSGTWTGSNITIGGSSNTSLANSISLGITSMLTVNSGGTVDADNNTVTVSGVTSFSILALYRRIFSDITGDGYVDAADLQRLGDCWHQTSSDEFTTGTDVRFFNYNKNTDGGNQIIDAADLQVFGDCWHNGVAP